MSVTTLELVKALREFSRPKYLNVNHLKTIDENWDELEKDVTKLQSELEQAEADLNDSVTYLDYKELEWKLKQTKKDLIQSKKTTIKQELEIDRLKEAIDLCIKYAVFPKEHYSVFEEVKSAREK